MRLVVEDTFAAAHRLLKHSGKCRNLHGHTWRVRVEIEGRPDEETGMVVDFGEVKQIIRDFDHKAIFSEDDPLTWLMFRNIEVIRLPFEPTCENLARLIAQRVAKLCGTRASLVRVTVWESENQSATSTVLVDGP